MDFDMTDLDLVACCRPLAAPALSDHEAEATAELFKALSDPARVRIVNILAIIFVIVVVYALNLPYDPTGLPWNDGFDAANVNYTPFAIVLPLIFGVWYLVSAKNKYQGPVRTLEEDEITREA